MKNVKKLLSLLCAGILAAGLFSGCTSKEAIAGAATNLRIDDIKKNGKLVIATANYKPFGYLDEKTKEIVGYDIDIAQKIADKLGVPLKVKSMESSELMPAIMNGEADLAISAFIYTVRKQKGC